MTRKYGGRRPGIEEEGRPELGTMLDVVGGGSTGAKVPYGGQTEMRQMCKSVADHMRPPDGSWDVYRLERSGVWRWVFDRHES